ncbi:MAG: hypothetical protein GKR89_18155 [Candidatus Latescibacteria bacterium]|nr:hypothetical protein [Candidatus Latescibacterota bacterium]
MLGAVGLLGALPCLYFLLDRPLPTGQPGAQAELLAQRMLKAVDAQAWKRTGAVRWTFADRHHLWDRERHLARVRWDDTEVLVNLDNGSGRAWRAGLLLSSAEGAAAVDKAYRYWINDAFWLNPAVKLFEPGVSLQQVATEAEDTGLLVTYSAGGATPGDSYLWLLGPDGLPRAWRMWVSILPLGGLEVSWQGWTKLSTGAQVATRHKVFFFDLELTNVAGAANLAALEPGPDPFTPFLEE